jgi:deoxyribodipyrimidine photo-lyase
MAFLFHRSLRLDDNKGLIECLKNNENVLPIFCLDPRQADPKKNPYFSPYCFGFMYQSLLDLKLQLKKYNSDLLILTGEPHKVLPPILTKRKIDTLYINQDYTPFSKKRAEQLKEKIKNVIEIQDYLLFDPNSILNKSKNVFRVYTPFLNATKKKTVPKPEKIKYTKNLASKQILSQYQNNNAWKLLEKHSKFSPLYTPAGRTEGLKRLKSMPQTQKKYSKCRNYLTYKTTNMSAYIKFGCVSIREAWYSFSSVGGESAVSLKRELIWREFYYHYYNAYPKELEWEKKSIEAKLKNNTPDVVKACFNELDKTGYLNNRGRMVLANYILKYQKDYWKNGDKMYAKRLVDYDPIVNIGNWKWIVKQPSFRTLKPETQYKRWDRTCDNKEKGTYTSKYLNYK